MLYVIFVGLVLGFSVLMFGGLVIMVFCNCGKFYLLFYLRVRWIMLERYYDENNVIKLFFCVIKRIYLIIIGYMYIDIF